MTRTYAGRAADPILSEREPQDRRQLGITVPPSILAQAEEVIE
jgi:hypothetical protein